MYYAKYRRNDFEEKLENETEKAIINIYFLYVLVYILISTNYLYNTHMCTRIVNMYISL